MCRSKDSEQQREREQLHYTISFTVFCKQNESLRCCGLNAYIQGRSQKFAKGEQKRGLAGAKPTAAGDTC